ncbi:MAG: acylneuraminate cytidylyltransferase family protein [Rhodothermales bacterium]|nr:acylneuraminate cytidylyltransferase family protein [Rhodothermales bacterium]MBO6781068.1 acylneuraminate cytidylyltransferase family protein [Rhodothermales bacterium]
MSVIGLITARAGSKRIPDKNVRTLGGRPLICWTFESATEARSLDRVVLSTDCPYMAHLARQQGVEVPFLRPAELAGDHSSHDDVVRHAVEALEGVEWVVLLQPTSPFRSAGDIDAAVELARRTGDAVIGVAEAPAPLALMWQPSAAGTLRPLQSPDGTYIRSQDQPPVYYTNGALYVFSREQAVGGSILESRLRPYVMPADRSLDIDTLEDFDRAELRFGGVRRAA